ncbi:MAG TPA: hypothetical protein VFO36_03180, partial [Nitrospiraceae bacterium]|nr:hypothetical protein [Nitrospiraceae bacterium]
PLGSMPLLVLTRGNRSSNLPADQAEAEWALVSKMHREIARLSTAGVARVIAGADHYIQLDKPEVVISAVTQVLSEARRRHGEEGTATSSL